MSYYFFSIEKTNNCIMLGAVFINAFFHSFKFSLIKGEFISRQNLKSKTIFIRNETECNAIFKQMNRCDDADSFYLQVNNRQAGVKTACQHSLTHY